MFTACFVVNIISEAMSYGSFWLTDSIRAALLGLPRFIEGCLMVGDKGNQIDLQYSNLFMLIWLCIYAFYVYCLAKCSVRCVKLSLGSPLRETGNRRKASLNHTWAENQRTIYYGEHHSRIVKIKVNHSIQGSSQNTKASARRTHIEKGHGGRP